MKKKLLALALTILMVLSLAGCSASGGGKIEKEMLNGHKWNESAEDHAKAKSKDTIFGYKYYNFAYDADYFDYTIINITNSDFSSIKNMFIAEFGDPYNINDTTASPKYCFDNSYGSVYEIHYICEFSDDNVRYTLRYMEQYTVNYGNSGNRPTDGAYMEHFPRIDITARLK